MQNSQEQTWFKRNRIWVLSIGIVVGLAALAGIAYLSLSFTLGKIRSTELYRQVMAQTRTNPTVLAALGSPIEEGLQLSFQFTSDTQSTTASLTVPVSGPRDTGRILAEATRIGQNPWTIDRFYLLIKDQTAIDLLAPGQEQPSIESTGNPENNP